jgi:hypothetical protein
MFLEGGVYHVQMAGQLALQLQICHYHLRMLSAECSAVEYTGTSDSRYKCIPDSSSRI